MDLNTDSYTSINSQFINSTNNHSSQILQSIKRKTKSLCSCDGSCPRCSTNIYTNDVPHVMRSELKISQPGDAYEQEADRVADQMMRISGFSNTFLKTIGHTKDKGIDCKSAVCYLKEEQDEELSNIQRKALPTKISHETNDSFSNKIYGISSCNTNGSSLDLDVKEFMESRFGYDFSNVRIHTDIKAKNSAKSISAQAYTIGNDIVFDNDYYKPNTFEGQRLLAHELTHVVQQSNMKESSPIIRRKKLRTLGGEWEDTKYVTIKDNSKNPPQPQKLEIELKFTPQPPVDASKIGMIQIVRSIENGHLVYRDNVEKRSIDRWKPNRRPDGSKEDDPDAGFHIDTPEINLSEPGVRESKDPEDKAERKSPMYQSGGSLKDDTLATTPVITNPLMKPPEYRGVYGERFTDKTGFHMIPAKLIDEPDIFKSKITGKLSDNSSKIFETAALAFEGKQAGTTYGSVQWGWTIDEKGNFHQLELAVKRMGIPSETFRRAAEIWNNSKTPSGKDVFKIPEMLTFKAPPGTEAKAIENLLMPYTSSSPDKDYAAAYQILNGQWIYYMLRTLSTLNKKGFLSSLYKNLGYTVGIGVNRDSVRRLGAVIEAVQYKENILYPSKEFWSWMKEHESAAKAGKTTPDNVPAGDIKEIKDFIGPGYLESEKL